jgi:CRISPR-associated protein Csb1
LAGDGAPVKPAIYEGPRFQEGRRWWGEGEARRVVDVIVIDNEPSEANRMEAALEAYREELGIPEIRLDLSATPLPPHLPEQISMFRFPHRNADAYLRDATLGGDSFMSSEVGRAVFDATADRPEALLQWCPQALLFGFWQSHLGKKRSQAKLARAWTSEIIGVEPAADDVRRWGLKGDPLNLSVADSVSFDDTAQEEWEFAAKGKRLSEIGHGQVPVGGEDAALAGVSFRQVVQQSTVSFASLRRIRAATGLAEARALLAALGLVGHVGAFGRPFNLRSGADLRPRTSTWLWLDPEGDRVLEVPDFAQARALFKGCVARAEAAGLPVGDRWASEPLVLQPAPNLAEAIRKSWPTD